MKKIISALIVSVLFILSGCRHDVLDASQSNALNSKIYANGGEDPFTGTYTNFNLRKVVKPGLIYTLDNYSSYAGGFEPRFAGSKCQVEVKQGRMVGEVTCRMPESEIVYTFSLSDGQIDGPVVGYRNLIDKTTLFSFVIKDGVFDGPMRFHRFKDGQKILDINWVKGDRRLELTYDPDTGNVLREINMLEGWYHGRSIQYDIDGVTVLFKADYRNGTVQGMSEDYDPRTRILTKTRMVDELTIRRELYHVGERGEVKLIRVINYDDAGHELPTGEEGEKIENNCFVKWLDAFRDEMGQEPIVKHDVIQEWEKKCRQGKFPKTTNK